MLYFCVRALYIIVAQSCILSPLLHARDRYAVRKKLKMNEEDRDIDVESDEVPEVGREATATTANEEELTGDVLDKRAHHNALERRRRDHIKDSFHGLRDCIPAMEGEKVSRAHILNKATDYIRHLQKGGLKRESEISDLKGKNEVLEEQVRAVEQAKALGSSETSDDILHSVAEQIHARQQRQHTLQLQHPPRSQGEQGVVKPAKSASDKTVLEGGKNGSKAAVHGSAPLARPSPTSMSGNQGKASKTPAENQLNFNLFAKSAQSLLSALQKTAGGNLPANVKSLAARVLASPLRAQISGTTPPQSVPRGIVTATTVTSQSAVPTSLTGFLQKELSAMSPTVVPKTTPQSQLKPTTPAVSKATGSDTTATNVATPTCVPASSTVTVSSSTTPNISTPQTRQITSTLLSQSISSQLLAANTLLKQSSAAIGAEVSAATNKGGRNNTSALSSNPQLTSEFLAQVSSFLNVPKPAMANAGMVGSKTEHTLAPAAVTSGSSSVAAAMDTGNSLDQAQEGSVGGVTTDNKVGAPSRSQEAKDTMATPGDVRGEGDKGVKRVAPCPPDDFGTSPKKPRTEQ